MNATALTLMIVVQVSVTGITGYFFWRVLKSPPEPDSYTEDKKEEV
ncbi:MAG TPA: hypothetical protein VJ991_00780 [Balneolales bacterium]|nr:hypothetical protein [Balneolales bacterium]